MNKELVHLQQVELANRVQYSTVLVVPNVKIKMEAQHATHL